MSSQHVSCRSAFLFHGPSPMPTPWERPFHEEKTLIASRSYDAIPAAHVVASACLRVGRRHPPKPSPCPRPPGGSRMAFPSKLGQAHPPGRGGFYLCVAPLERAPGTHG